MNKLLAIALFALMVTACGSPVTEADIPGKWHVTKFEADLHDLSPALIQGAEEIALSSTYSFAQDGVVIIKDDYNTEGSTSTYSFDEESSTLTIIGPEGRPSTQSIISSSSTRMVWKQDMEEFGSLELTLEKK